MSDPCETDLAVDIFTYGPLNIQHKLISLNMCDIHIKQFTNMQQVSNVLGVLELLHTLSLLTYAK